MALNVNDVQATFFIDQEGTPRVNCQQPFFALGDWIETDLGSCKDAVDEVLAEIDRVTEGQQPPYEMTGNAYQIEVTPQEAQISCLWSEDEDAHCTITKETLIWALFQWKGLL